MKQVAEIKKRMTREMIKLRQITVEPLGERGRGRYHAQADNRQGEDRSTPHPYLSFSAIQDEFMRIMWVKEREFKSRAKPQDQTISTQSIPVHANWAHLVARVREGYELWQPTPVKIQVWRNR